MNAIQNTQVDKETITRLMGMYQERYGLKIDETMACWLHEVERLGMVINSQKNKELQQVLNLTKPFQTTDYKAALAFGFSKNLGLVMAGLALLLFVVLHHFRETTKIEFLAASQVINRYPNIVELEPLIKEAKLINNKDGLFISFSTVKEKMITGKTFVQSSNQNEVLVPLRFN